MSDTNPAQAAGNDEALTEQGGADAILDLLPDPETDLQEDQGQGEPKQEEPEEKSEDDLLAEAVANETSDEKEEDGQQESDSGRFAADNANVRLKDGSVISVQDLKRGYLAQASFTRSTQELAKERETLASKVTEVESTAQALKQQRDFLLQASQQFLPQPPDRSLLDQSSPNYDPIRYMQAKDEYDAKVHALQQLHQMTQAEQARMEQQQQGGLQEKRKQEAQKLIEVMPEFKKPGVHEKFWADAVDTMAQYGFSEEEMNATLDHRVYKIYRDLAVVKRARLKAPAVKEKVESRPVLQGNKRMDPREKGSRERQVRHEQLRKTGSFDAGVSALMDLDL